MPNHFSDLPNRFWLLISLVREAEEIGLSHNGTSKLALEYAVQI
jgi:hypothetical protein